MSYSGRIMNISGKIVGNLNPYTPEVLYKMGHRDARHAAAEIATEAENEIDRLKALPYGVGVEPIMMAGFKGYQVSTPRENGVRGNTCVWEDSDTPAEQVLYLILEKMLGDN